MTNKHTYYFIIIITVITNPNFIVSANLIDFTGDYSPPSPPPHPPSLSCESDLRVISSLDTSCEVNSSLVFDNHVYIEGLGSLVILPNVRLACGIASCEIVVNVSCAFRLGEGAGIVGGTVSVTAGNVTFAERSVVNVSSLGGDPPEYTSGSPKGVFGGGGGYGGRCACCVAEEF